MELVLLAGEMNFRYMYEHENSATKPIFMIINCSQSLKLGPKICPIQNGEKVMYFPVSCWKFSGYIYILIVVKVAVLNQFP